jgi:hypothetical protein
MDKKSWTELVTNEEVLQRLQKDGNILHTVNRRKANWIGHISRWSYVLRYLIEGRIEGRKEVTGRRGRKSRQLLNDLIETRGCGKLKEEALYRTLWETRFARGYGSVARQTG